MRTIGCNPIFASIMPEEDTPTLVKRAYNLVNKDGRIASSTVYCGNTNNSTPNFIPSSQVKLNKKYGTVKDARRRIREEWEALKNSTILNNDESLQEGIQGVAEIQNIQEIQDSPEILPTQPERKVLYSVVVYIEINANERHVMGLKAQLASMGATVKEKFTQEVTHVIFKGGSTETYKRAKLLNVHLVSILWVEACMNRKAIVCERLYPVNEKNEYSHSARNFRKYLEFQSKNLRYDETTGNIIRKTYSRPPSLVQNLQNLNIVNKKVANANDKSNEEIIEPLPDPTSTEDKNYDEDSDNISMHLRVSSEGSGDADISNALTSNDTPDKDLHDKSSDSQTSILNEANLQDGETLAIDHEEVISRTSPIKRKLFPNRPLESSVIRFPSDLSSTPSSQQTRKPVVPNPYQILTKSKTPSKSVHSPKKKNLNTECQPNAPTKQKQPIIRPSRIIIPEPQKLLTANRHIGNADGVFKKRAFVSRSPNMCTHNHNKCPSLVSTSLHSFENKSLKEVISTLGGFHFKAVVDSSTTHVVAGKLRRTVNLLKAVARGCWVLTPQWVEASIAAGRWLAEENYELVEFSKVVQRNRIQKQSFGKNFSLNIFDDCGLIYISRNCSPSYKDLKQLIILCGGAVTSNIRIASVAIAEISLQNAKCVTEQWVLDSITFGRVKNYTNYFPLHNA